jgi:environmental stress-induced protein Ves
MTSAHARIQVIPANEYRRERWKNGLGWTREIVRVPDQGEWAWRLSIAEIEQDAVFSAFPGVDRELALLSGNGLRLCFGDGRVDELLPPHASARFAGEDAVTGELIDGRTTDFNLMWRRGIVDAQLWHRPLVGAMVVFVDPGDTWVVHLVAGQARFADGSNAPLLEAGDTALLGADHGRARAVIDGAGDVLLVKIAPVSSSS